MQKSIREMIRVVPQATSLFNNTIHLERERDSELNKVALSAQFIVDIICLLPEGWDILVGDCRLELSRAKRGRIVFLLKDSPVVVFDETTSILGIVTEDSIKQILEGISTRVSCPSHQR